MKYILEIGILVPTEPIYQICFISDFDPLPHTPSGIETFCNLLELPTDKIIWLYDYIIYKHQFMISMEQFGFL